MDPMTAISLGTQGVKMIGGIIQTIAGKRILKKTKLPDYEIMPEFQKNVALAQGMKTQGMPGEVYSRGLNDISRNMSFGMKTLGERRGVLAGIGNMVTRSNDAVTNLNVSDANIRTQNFRAGAQMEMGANNQLGLQKIAKMQWEKLNPYSRKIAEGQALVGAGMQNFFGGASGIGSTVMSNSINPSGVNPWMKRWGMNLQKSINTAMVSPV